MKGEKTMATNGNTPVAPNAKDALNQLKTEVASQIGVNLKQGYNGNLTSREAGSIGGEMVKRMITYAENNISGSGMK